MSQLIQKNLLLDSHLLVWLVSGKKTGPKTIAAIQSADIVYVSALTILELRLKKSIGKLPEAEKIIGEITTMDLLIVDFNEKQSRDFQVFTNQNRDPFDNALVSIAINESLLFVTADTAVLSANIKGLKTINALA